MGIETAVTQRVDMADLGSGDGSFGALSCKTSPALRAMIAADAESLRRATQRLLLVGTWVWPFFFVLDAYMVFLVYPSAPLWHFVALRLTGEVLLIGSYWVSRRRELSIRYVNISRDISYTGVALCISLMALDLGGVNSTYMDGISIAMLIRCVLIPAPWWTTLRDLVPLTAMFPMVMAGAAAFCASVTAASLGATTLASVVGHYIFVVASNLIGAMCSHLVWAAQRQVYQARKLGRYRLEAPIGQGGMGDVWLAWDATLRRKVALKVLRTTQADGGAVRRFEREAHLASMLNDPHTVRIFDFGASDDGIYYIAMEYLAGADLGALLSMYGRMPSSRAIRFILQACGSLAEAHAAGIIHRDIKPQNLFVTCVGDDPDFVKLLDFGIARVGGGAEEGFRTRTGIIQGTPEYMAPELFLGQRADVRSDIYAIGATLYALLMGVPPYTGDSPGRLMAAQQSRSPPALSSGRREPVAAELEAVVLRCLDRDPDARFLSVVELAEALAPFADDSTWSRADAVFFWRDHLTRLARMDAPTQ